jgi:hypothetical protein
MSYFILIYILINDYEDGFEDDDDDDDDNDDAFGSKGLDCLRQGIL